jgi:hypothetical protein
MDRDAVEHNHGWLKERNFIKFRLRQIELSNNNSYENKPGDPVM